VETKSVGAVLAAVRPEFMHQVLGPHMVEAIAFAPAGINQVSLRERDGNSASELSALAAERDCSEFRTCALLERLTVGAQLRQQLLTFLLK